MRVSVRRADERGRLVVRATRSRRSDEPPVGGATARRPRRVADGGRLLPLTDPGSPPFVEVGDVVTVGQTLCLLEAMKLFNELKAEQDGRPGGPRRER